MFGSLGMPEILFILVIALIIFGPKKLPQLGRSLGEGLAQSRKASEDFKRTWEVQATVEERQLSPPTLPPPTVSSQPETASESKEPPVTESQQVST